MKKHPEYEEQPVTIEVFVNDPYYLNLSEYIRPEVMKILIDIFGKEIKADRFACIDEGLITGAIGIGKCLGKDTPVIMYDGTVKMVQDIEVGEQLMGDDSTPRNVLSVTTGREMMYRITPIKGDSFICNESHILSLKHTGREGVNRNAGKIINMSVKDYLEQSDYFKRVKYKLYRVPVEFDTQEVSIDPYFLGVWLGDGDSHRIAITSMDQEIIDETYRIAEKFNMGMTVADFKDNQSSNYHITNGKNGGQPNIVTSIFKKYNLINNKHIPQEYKSNSREIRLELLAGLIDTDGWVDSKCFSFSNKNERLIDDVEFLARSLGFGVTKKSYEIKETTYYGLCIYGDTNIVPTRLARKQTAPRLQKKSPLMTGFKVEKLEEDDYYGFTIDGNSLFLLGDFTVTHNTFIDSILTTYIIYRLLCLKNPQQYFGLAPGDQIAHMQMSSSRTTSEDVVFNAIKARATHSKWFQDRYPPNPDNTRVTKRLYFAKDISVIPGDSLETTFEGYHIFSAIIDEADSHKITPTKDYAQIGYEAMDKRIKSRYNDKGILFISGTHKLEDGFISGKIKEFNQKPNSRSYELSIWKAKGETTKGGFWFDIQRRQIVPKKISDETIRVPAKYLQDFQLHPETSLRDLAGIPPKSGSPFISKYDKVYDASARYVVNYGIMSPVDEFGKINREYSIRNSLPRVIHLDLSTGREDAAAIAMGHIDHWVPGENEEHPYIVIDFMMRLKYDNEEVQIADLRKIIYELQDRGTKISKVTMDSFASEETIQQLKKKRIKAEVFSPDKNPSSYYDMRDAIYEDRIEFPEYYSIIGDKRVQILTKELLELTYKQTPQGDYKIEHPRTGGSKDLADCVAGVCYAFCATPKKKTGLEWTPYYQGHNREGELRWQR